MNTDRQSRPLRHAGLLVLILAVGACTSESSDPPLPRALTLQAAGPIPASPQREGDAARGREALLTENYVGCGLPASAWRQLQGSTPIATLSGRNEASENLPYFLNAVTDDDGVDLVVNNCLSCHGATLFGEVVIGLGNEFADFTGNPSTAVERAGLAISDMAEAAAWERYADRIAAISPHVQMPTIGSNPANNLTFALMAYRDPDTHAWSDTPLLPLPTQQPPPVSVPPWWRMKKKHAMFNLGEGRGDHARYMMAASMMCIDELDELQAIDEYAPDIRAYITSLEPPIWPFSIDTGLAEKGQTIFEQTCSACHGRYGETSEYPNLLVDIEVLGSDPALMEQARDTGGPWVEWFRRSYYGKNTQVLPGSGYVAPPLDGIWATGPYLHNGSVPTIAHVLDSSTRPEIWMSLASDGNDRADYDTERLGWRYKPVTLEQTESLDSNELKRIYNTNRHGHSNSGHRFGDALSEAERAAVVEYLKTL